jgi:hypothetical protein
VQPVHETVLEQSVTYLPYPTSFHSIIIDYHDKEQAEKIDIFLRSLIKSRNELARSSIREIRVNGRDYYGNWTLVEEVFHSLHDLENVHWYNYQPMPPRVLESLEALNPSAKLHYHSQFDRVNYVTEKEIEDAKSKIKARRAIANSMNLHSFTGDIDYGWKNNRQMTWVLSGKY